MKQSLAVKASVSMLADQVVKLDATVKRCEAKYDKVKSLLEQALFHRHRLERTVKAVGRRNGACWCVLRGALPTPFERVVHSAVCNDLFLALYGAERGE